MLEADKVKILSCLNFFPSEKLKKQTETKRRDVGLLLLWGQSLGLVSWLHSWIVRLVSCGVCMLDRWTRLLSAAEKGETEPQH